MKCEKCNEREANFFYTATINGQTTQRHLCSECAAQEGFDQVFDLREHSMFDSFFAQPFGMLDSFFGGRSLFGSLMPAMTLPRTLFAPAREAQTPQPEAAPQEAAESKIPADAGAEIRSRREIAALRHQLHAAVKAEDFEKAIELRDKLKELEK